MSPLIKAAEKGSVEILKLLIENGANIESIYKDGGNALYFASMGKSSNAAMYLINQGANVNVEHNTFVTPVAQFINHGNIEMTRILLEHGASFDYERKLIGLGERTALVSSILEGKYTSKMVDLLVEHKYPVETYLKGFHILYFFRL